MKKVNRLNGNRSIKLKFENDCDFNEDNYLFSVRINNSDDVYPIKIGKRIRTNLGDINYNDTSFKVTLYVSHNPIDNIFAEAEFPVLVEDYKNTSVFRICVKEAKRLARIIISGGLP